MTKREASQPEIDWAAFGRAVMSPARPHLEEAVGAAREVVEERWRSLRGRSRMSAAARTEALTDPAVVSGVCETLASRLDAHWLLDGARSFLPYVQIDWIGYSQSRLPRPSDTPRQLSDTPYEVELVAALAAGDPRDIGTVEALAMEAANAIAPWGIRMPSRVAWVLLSSGWPEDKTAETDERHDVWTMASNAAVWSLPIRYDADEVQRAITESRRIEKAIISQGTPVKRGQDSRRAPRANALAHITMLAKRWSAWSSQSLNGYRISDVGGDHTPDRLHGVPMRDIANPIDAYLRAWGLGYAIVDIRGDVVVVGAPAAGDTISAPSWSALRSMQMERYGSIM